MSDLTTFLKEIYEEFRRRRLYNSTVLILYNRMRECDESEYDYTDDSPDDHIFVNGPLPGDYTFKIFMSDIQNNRIYNGYQLWLVDVCELQNMWNNWRIVLEVEL